MTANTPGWETVTLRAGCTDEFTVEVDGRPPHHGEPFVSVIIEAARGFAGEPAARIDANLDLTEARALVAALSEAIEVAGGAR